VLLTDINGDKVAAAQAINDEFGEGTASRPATT
jgi:hypothetical protein